jgi:hypothetical protein
VLISICSLRNEVILTTFWSKKQGRMPKLQLSCLVESTLGGSLTTKSLFLGVTCELSRNACARWGGFPIYSFIHTNSIREIVIKYTHNTRGCKVCSFCREAAVGSLNPTYCQPEREPGPESLPLSLERFGPSQPHDKVITPLVEIRLSRGI